MIQDVNRDLSVTVGDLPDLPDSPPEGFHGKVEDMEVAQSEDLTKKRKADASPIYSISSGENKVAPYSLRGSRKCRIVYSLMKIVLWHR